MNLIRNLGFSLLVTVVFAGFCLVAGEIAFRTYYFYQYGISLFNGTNDGLATRDARLGWRISDNLKFEVTAKDALGRDYKIDFQTFKYGSRLLGNANSPSVKLMFVGDSFTAAVEVSNDKTYYSLLKAWAPNVEYFAFGSGGHGTLQEYVVIDEHLDEILPDAIIIQFCWNDFYDNDYDLDRMKTLYNHGMPRPYLQDDGSILYDYPKKKLFFQFPNFIQENLRILKYFDKKITMLGQRIHGEPVIDEVERLGTNLPAFERSVSRTRTILQMIKDRAGHIPVYLFAVPYRQPYYSEIRQLCKDTNIIFIDEVAQALRQKEEESPLSTKAADLAHLNEEGNYIVAVQLFRSLKATGVLDGPNQEKVIGPASVFPAN